MGGFGSGRWSWHRKKRTVESCRTLSVAVLVGDRPPAAGHTGRLEWRDPAGAVTASVAFAFATPRVVVLAYRCAGDPEPHGYPLHLEPLPTPNGGTRYLARCPLVVGGVPCRRRAAKLYHPPGSSYFGCRHCHRLAYRGSQGHDPRVSALLQGGPERLFELAERPSRLPVPMLGRVLFALKEWQRRSDRVFKRFDPKPPPRRRKKP